MAGRTNSEKIDSLQVDVTRLAADLDNLEEKSSTEADSLHEQVGRLTERANAAERDIAVVQQRCTSLEKLSDRHWQVWLALLSGLIALVVAIFRK